MSNVHGPSAAPQRRAPRWLWAGFFISLAINLAVLGTAIGAAWHFHTTKAFRDGGVPRYFSVFLRRLPAGRRDEFRDLLSHSRPLLNSLRDKVKVARREVEAVMANDPFDQAAFATANRKLHGARAAFSAERVEIFTRIAASMTSEERQLFLKWRRQHRYRRRRGDSLLP